jgi:hypothetical protein
MTKDKTPTAILSRIPSMKPVRTPEQQQAYEEVTKRNDAIQQTRLKQPASGVWGRAPK